MADIDISGLMKSMNGGGSSFKQDGHKNKTYGQSSNNGHGNNNGNGHWSKNSNNKNSNYKSNNNHNNNYAGNKNKNFDSSKYVGAPYNFVPFYNEVVPVNEESMRVHNLVTDELLSGEISYTVKAETPIFISDGNKEPQFVRDEIGRVIIPGSSMRGLIRNNVQILGLSGFDDDIEDYNLMYRNVTSGVERARYNQVLGAGQINVGKGKMVSVLKNVKAGYITKSKSEYVIYPTVVDQKSSGNDSMNYYVLSERTVAEDMKSGKTAFPFLRKHSEYAQHVLEEGFIPIHDGDKTQYEGTQNKKYRPFYTAVSYELKNLRNVTSLGEPGEFSNAGVLVGTGPMRRKKALYVVPKVDKDKAPLIIPQKDVDAFIIDFKKKEKTLRGNEEYFKLPDEGEFKPVFYIYLEGRLYFGFTPRLRLFYDKSIKEGLHQNKQRFDYAKSIFGVSSGDDSYKSKVAFCDAILSSELKMDNEQKYILSEPKPTSYLDYIDQSNGTKTYNSAKFDLKGVKQYWLREKTIPDGSEVKNEKVRSTLRPLVKGTEFRGIVRFNNLSAAELGLLLWSIKLNDDCRMNIGMGKAYGFGVISVNDVSLKLIDVNAAYSLTDGISMNPLVDKDSNQYIEKYKSEISSKIGNTKIDELKHIKDFFAMKDYKHAPKEEDIRYMKIDNKEYQSRKKPLQSISDLIKK